MSKIKVTFVETNCKKNGPIKQTLNIIRNMDKEVFEPSLVTVWPEDADNSMIDEYKKLGIPVLSANMSKKKSVLFGKKEVGQLLEQLQPDIVQGVGMPPYRMTLGYKRAIHFAECLEFTFAGEFHDHLTMEEALIREDYSRQYDGLRAALQEAENKKVQVEQQIEEYLNMTSHLEEHLDNFEFDIQLVKSLVQKIEVSADKRIRIVFGFRDVFTELGKESAET